MRSAAFALAVLALAAAVVARAQDASGPSPLDGFRVDPAWVPVVAPPASHDEALWETTHGAAAAVGGDGDCASCHVEETCASCHASENVAVAVHPAGYVVLHGSDAADTASCTSCHTPSRFCRSCHLEAELGGETGARPPAWASVHPTGWLEPGATDGHAREARLDLLSCVGCHDGDECVRCHIDVSPHDMAFVDRCGPMLRAGEPTCARCHTPASRLPLEALRRLPGCDR